MATIEIDFQVFKALTGRRESEDVTYNDVLRTMLGLSVEEVAALPPGISGSWTWKGVTLPDGTELKSEYKGQAYLARIEGGRWVQDNKVFTSPSAAAFAITQSGINGWWFWSVKRPSDSTWMPLNKLRPGH